ncbi:uncharacterized protein [Periplaneta americana]|uniref:uncharacterized protein n=1 Tax=Periplaneta americana TaxID=6978 RepID=UPI0037E77C78
MCFRYLSTGMTFRTLSQSYRIGESTVAVIVKEVCEALWQKLQLVYLPKPNKKIWLEKAEEFMELWQFPYCIGNIDGKHVVIWEPVNSGSHFFNYKKQFSVVLLALVDAKNKFFVIDVGSCGRFSDGNILTNSAFGRALRNQQLDLPPPSLVAGAYELPYVIVGDAAFPLMVNLMKPFPKPQLNDMQKKIFNYRLSRARRLVESAFGILSTRWRVFLKPFEIGVENVDKVVKATVVFHNYLRSQKSRGSVKQELSYFAENEGQIEPQNQLLPLHLVMAFADDIVIIGRSLKYVEEAFLALEKSGKEMGMVINEGQTKYMVATGGN